MATTPDPILPEKLVHFGIPAPGWLKSASPEVRATQAVGSAPYLLAEFVKGQHIIFKANPTCWVYYMCGGRNHVGCDEEWDRRYTEAKHLTGDAREKAFQALWEYAYDKYWYVPLFGLNWAHGASNGLVWEPRVDGQVVFTEISLKS